MFGACDLSCSLYHRRFLRTQDAASSAGCLQLLSKLIVLESAPHWPLSVQRKGVSCFLLNAVVSSIAAGNLSRCWSVLPRKGLEVQILLFGRKFPTKDQHRFCTWTDFPIL